MFARQLAGVVDGGLALTGYLPASMAISGGPKAVKGVTVSGNYPFEEGAIVRFDLSAPVDFAVDFPLPVGATSMTVSVEGTRQRLTPMPSGYRRLRRRWSRGETVEVRLELPISPSYHTDSSGGRWVAFLRGPLVLAEGVPEGPPGASAAHPGIDLAKDPAASLELLRSGTPLSYRIQRTGEVLVPYYLAGSSGGGVRTLFRVSAQRSR